MIARPRLAAPTSADAGRMIVRRKCACGARAGPVAQSCPDCERKKLQPKLVVGSQHAAEEREADRVADAVMRDGDGRAGASVGAISSAVQRSSAGPAMSTEPQAPPIVDRVLGRSGQALDSDAKHFFERRFERDFSNVRVHADAEAAASARAVDAAAYTVGEHLVFAEGRYAPATLAGRRLLAHELTHVVQQGEALRRKSAAPKPNGKTRDHDDKQTIQRLLRHPANVSFNQADVKILRKKADAGGGASATPADCKPAIPPGWDSFQGAVPAEDAAAATFSGIRTVSGPDGKRFQGVFDPAQSWVKPQYRFPRDPTKNESAAVIAECKASFGPGQPGGGWALATDAACPAYQPRGDWAKNAAECSTIVAQDYTDTNVVVAQRILKHEQMHLGVTCGMATKGNVALAGGKTHAEVDAVIHLELDDVQDRYDSDTNHSCNVISQKSWETNISNGLPNIKLFP